MRIAPLAVTVLFLIGALPAAHAETMVVAGRSINLPMPHGYCAVKDVGTEGQLVARSRQGIGAKNRLLLLLANCDELKAMRSLPAGSVADGFDDFVIVSVLQKDGEVSLFDQSTRQQYIDNVTKAISHGQAYAAAIKRAEARIRDISSMRELEGLGVLDADANALYFGLAGQNTATNQGMVGVGGSTLVKGLSLSVTVYCVAKGPGDLGRLLVQQKSELATVVAANK